MERDILGHLVPRIQNFFEENPGWVSPFALANALHLQRWLLHPRLGVDIDFELDGDRPYEKPRLEAVEYGQILRRRASKELVISAYANRREEYGVTKDEVSVALHGHGLTIIDGLLRATFVGVMK